MNFFKPVEPFLLKNFLIGSLGLILGLSIFLTGVDLSISKIGSIMGEFVANIDKIFKVILFGMFIGFIISTAEPDLLILANQISSALGLSANLIVAIISVGVGVLLSIGLYRIFKDISMYKLMMIIYGLVFILMIFVDDMGHAIAFDASGATTGAMTTPFIISLGLGISRLKGQNREEEDSFGLVGIASSGPVIASLLMSMITGKSQVSLETVESISPLEASLRSSILAILPIVIVFFVMNFLYFKKKNLRSIILGLIYTFIGLVLFLYSVEAGFMELARAMGSNFTDSRALPFIGFILGLLVVLAEPAVYVLSHQVEEVTGGHINRKSILTCLSIGVALAVTLAMIKLKSEIFKTWMIVVPALTISLFLSRKIPQIFVGIAFDSGGVASGPMTATFILAFCQGVAGNIQDGFGVIAFVAMMPIVTIMILGNLYKESR